jgi:hypothetical protein
LQDLHRDVERNKAGIEATRAEVASKRREGETVGLTLSSETQQLAKAIEEMTAKSAVVRLRARVQGCCRRGGVHRAIGATVADAMDGREPTIVVSLDALLCLLPYRRIP